MDPLPVLTVEEQRVLGSLLEKEVTVPASYPMTVTAVRTACNQASSREPVVDYDERLVHDTLRTLKDRELVAVTWEDRGRRTLKYLQTIADRRGWAPDERALLTVLLLRGAQPPGALKTRSERLHAFADRTEVESCLARMAAAEQPLVRQLPRAPREQDARWVHLLGPVEAPTSTAHPAGAGPAVDRGAVLADGVEGRDRRVRAAYDAVAEPYAAALSDELDGLPFERWLLERVAGEPGPVVEAGCGPGHVTAFLAAAGADASGLDASPAMVAEARRRHPGGRYEVGDLRALMRPPAADGWGTVLAWYSLIHLAPSELPGAIGSLVRPLRPGGLLVLALHAGSGLLELDSWFERDVELDVVLHERAEIITLLDDAGLVDVEWYRRGPLTARGETTERLYLLARRPAG